MIDYFIFKMANQDPTKYSQIANENTLCDYIKWQTFKMREFAIEKDQLDKSNGGENNKSTTYSRDEMIEMFKNGVFDVK